MSKSDMTWKKWTKWKNWTGLLEDVAMLRNDPEIKIEMESIDTEGVDKIVKAAIGEPTSTSRTITDGGQSMESNHDLADVSLMNRKYLEIMSNSRRSLVFTLRICLTLYDRRWCGVYLKLSCRAQCAIS